MPKLIRYDHDLSFAHSFSLDQGVLQPICAIDVLPGDTIRTAAQMLARVAPLQKPVMQPVELMVHFWYVPNRIVWEDWEDFITGNEGSVTFPTITPASVGDAVLFDHMGAEPVSGVEYDALPVRAYNLIWNEFYRDQDLSTARTVDLSDGADTTSDTDLARVAWPKDYFTTARPTPQQGSAISIDLTGTNPEVAYDGASSRFQVLNDSTGDYHRMDSSGSNLLPGSSDNPEANALYAKLDSGALGIDVTDLLQSIALQRIAEAREFAGSRYVDYLRWYGVNPSDGRLDRPEYIGGGGQRVSFSEVLATAANSSPATSVGELFGHGIAGLRSRPARKMFEEHGWLIGVCFARPKAIYQNGIPKRFLRRQPTDFWHRELEVLPWQAVNELEIYGGGSSSNTFGYCPRYDEYRENQSYVSGTFRGGTEEDWTLAREFASAPSLNETFVTCTPSDRIYQDTSMPELLVSANLSLRAKRLVSAQSRLRNFIGI